MSEPLRLKLGLKTHKGVPGHENEDRILIGMDPASNDWLYSPEDVTTGDFGVAVVLADGIGQGQHGGKAASIICQTIKKLFDEMLEMPPEDAGILQLLQKFMVIANQQILLKAKENPELQNFASSASLALIKDFKAYIVWAGNTRVYRYSAQGVKGTFAENLPNIEQLNLDHTYANSKELWGAVKLPQDKKLDDLFQYFGLPHHQFKTGAFVTDLLQGEKILLCTEGLFDNIPVNKIQDILSQDILPDLLCDELVTASFHAGAKNNISVILTEVLNGPTSNSVEIRPLSARIAMARKIFPPLELPIEEENKEPKTTEGPKSQQHDETRYIKPMKVRTVLPEVHSGESEEEKNKHQESRKSDEQTTELPTRQSDPVTPYAPPPISEGKSKPRIMATAYPDPSDYTKAEDPPTTEPVEKDIKEETLETPPFTFLGNDDVPLEDQSQSESEVTDAPDEIVNDKNPTEEEAFLDFSSYEIEKSEEVEDQLHSFEEEESSDDRMEEDEEEVEIDNHEALVPPHEEDDDEPLLQKTGIKEDISNSDPKADKIELPRPNNGKNIFRIGIVVLAIILLGWFICNQEQNASFDELGLDQPKDENTNKSSNNKEQEKQIAKSDPPKIASEQTEQPIQKQDQVSQESQKKEEKEKEKEVKPEEKTAVVQKKEPNYDAKILANKQQLIDEIKALIKKKNELCRQIDTYQKNAPTKKKEKVQTLNYDCDQLDKKFSSIYDPKTGFFLTERYDFLSGTLENIKFSINQTDKKFEEIRLEQ